MKALKEKRLSLRSLLRGGLVILSLFAIALAIGCNSSTEPDPVPTDPSGNTVAPTGPYVLSINILTQPTSYSIQGDRPNLTGLVVEVLWSDTKVEIVDSKWSEKLSITPEFCDVPSTQQGNASKIPIDPVGGFNVAYIGHTECVNQNLKLPYVVKIDGVTAGTPTKQDWYSDDRPDLTGLEYTLIINQGWYTKAYDDAAAATKAGEPMPLTTKVVKATANYPPVNLADVADKKVEIAIGKGTATEQKATFTISNYYVATGIDIIPGVWDTVDIFDDDVSTFFNDNGTIKASGVYDKLKAAGVGFKVYYNEKADLFRNLTIDQFRRNNAWYKGVDLADDTLWLGVGVVGVGAGTRQETYGTFPGTMILAYNTEDETWRVDLEYAPISKRVPSSASTIAVNIPVLVFQELVTPVAMKPGSNEPVITGRGVASTLSKEEMAAINNRWKLEGSYGSGGTPVYKAITITDSMIYLGQATGNAGLAAASGQIKVSVASGYNGQTNNGVGADAVADGYQLPLFYRGQRITGEDTITTSVINKE